ncbi:MAG: flagellar brake protein [Eubacteriaceae bacterium]
MDIFKINSKIELVTEDEDTIVGLIQDINENKIYVSIPPDDRNFKFLRIGQILKGVIYKNEKVIGFNTTLSDRIRGELPTYELSDISNFYTIQRRQNVRIPCTTAIKYSGNKYLLNICDSNNEGIEIQDKIIKYLNEGIMSDLSAGGLRFACSDNFYPNQMLLLLFNIGTENIIAKGRIIYKNITNLHNKSMYFYGMKFEDLIEEKQEKIINHIFILMRKNILK